ncbi:MAG TPA: heme-binding domain-containing protein, partial [Chitinophagaceae bacterium]|nr:heme-binding domain-containing protein [Chitinophagaceae bacterium]
SNNTEYPWYTNIQPVGWWMQDHVDVGKKQLNFSEFGTYPAEGQHHKMEEVIEQVKGDHMPLNSYLWMHGDAKLNAEQKNKVIEWAERLRQHIAQQHNVN